MYHLITWTFIGKLLSYPTDADSIYILYNNLSDKDHLLLIVFTYGHFFKKYMIQEITTIKELGVKRNCSTAVHYWGYQPLTWPYLIKSKSALKLNIQALQNTDRLLTYRAWVRKSPKKHKRHNGYIYIFWIPLLLEYIFNEIWFTDSSLSENMFQRICHNNQEKHKIHIFPVQQLQKRLLNIPV